MQNPKDGKVPEKREKMKKTIEKGKADPSVIKWTIEEEASLEKNHPELLEGAAQTGAASNL